jgi:hypothetical protein
VITKSYIFRDITLCSPFKVNQHFGGTYCLLATCFLLISCLAYSSTLGSACYLLHAGFLLAYSLTLKMEVTCFSEMLVDFQQTASHYIPEERTLKKIRKIFKVCELSCIDVLIMKVTASLRLSSRHGYVVISVLSRYVYYICTCTPVV